MEALARRRSLAALALVAAWCLVVAPGTAAGFTQAQADSGARIYQRQCARCHGPNLEGKDDSYKGLRAPELVGPSALPCKPRPYQKVRAQDFHTVKDVYDFVSSTMPADQPASLEAAQYWNVLAFVLGKNGKVADSNRLDASSSAQIALNAACNPTSPSLAGAK